MLRRLAGKYVWWKSPDDAAAMPERVTAQVMDIGTLDDITQLCADTDEEYLRHVLVTSEAGQFRHQARGIESGMDGVTGTGRVERESKQRLGRQARPCPSEPDARRRQFAQTFH